MALRAMAADGQLTLSHYLINSVKFLSPVQPGETLNINHSISSQGILSFNISANGRKIATGKITPKTQQTPSSAEDINT
jgi:acyl dehydratase